MIAGRKRVLFVTPPGYGHIFPVVPVAWAFQASGHDVLVATCGVSVAAASRAGLSVVNVAPAADLPAIYRRFRDDYREAFYDPTEAGKDEGAAPPFGETFFTVIGDAMVDGLMTLVEVWRPHLIVHTPYAAAAPIAASKHEIPAVFLGFSIAYTPQAMFEGVYSLMTRTWERFGAGGLNPPMAWIDVIPPSLRKTPLDGWLMRHVPYGGGELLESEALSPPRQPRVAVTVGTVVPQAEGLTSLQWLVDAARHVKAEFVIVHDTRSLGALPSNVRSFSWLGHGRLFAACTAVIHHAGPGTLLTALDAGLPQLVMPRGADQFCNAEALTRRGVALAPNGADLDASMICRLVSDESLRAAAEEVRAEIRSMPSPADLVPRILALA